MYRIAIVEDEAPCREELRGYIERYGQEHGQEFSVYPFADGSEILQNYEPRYDVILLDIEMPRVGGMEAAQAIREWTKTSYLSLSPTWRSMPSRDTASARWILS